MKNLENLSNLISSLPEDVRENAENLVQRMGEVIEGISDKPIEFRPPNLKVVQGTSDRSALPKGATIGSLVIGEEILETPYTVYPIMSWTSRQKWNPDPEISNLECQSPDGEVGFRYGSCKDCVYKDFDKENNKPQCNKTSTFLVLSADFKYLFQINFSKTNYANGQDWIKAMKTAGVSPYKRSYRLKTETSSKSKNVEILVAEAYAGNKSSEEVLPFLTALYTQAAADRKTGPASFHEYIKNKATDQVKLLGHQEGPSDGVVLLDAPESGSETSNVSESSVTRFKL